MWGHRVANKAIDFLEGVGEDPFVLVVSFDEPHGPCVAPPEYWENFPAENVPKLPNFDAPLDNKPEVQQIQGPENPKGPWEAWAAGMAKMFACNSYIDREIGRVIDTVDRLCPDDTVIIYTSDHGGHMRSHSLTQKGPAMYDETTRIPFIVRGPGVATGSPDDSGTDGAA